MCDAWSFVSPPSWTASGTPRLTMYTVGRGEHSRPSDFIQLCGASPSGPQRPNSAEYVLCHRTGGAPRQPPRPPSPWDLVLGGTSPPAHPRQVRVDFAAPVVVRRVFGEGVDFGQSPAHAIQ